MMYVILLIIDFMYSSMYEYHSISNDLDYFIQS